MHNNFIRVYEMYIKIYVHNILEIKIYSYIDYPISFLTSQFNIHQSVKVHDLYTRCLNGRHTNTIRFISNTVSSFVFNTRDFGKSKMCS